MKVKLWYLRCTEGHVWKQAFADTDSVYCPQCLSRTKGFSASRLTEGGKMSKIIWEVTEMAPVSHGRSWRPYSRLVFPIRLKLYGENRKAIFLSELEAVQLASDLLTLVERRRAQKVVDDVDDAQAAARRRGGCSAERAWQAIAKTEPFPEARDPHREGGGHDMTRLDHERASDEADYAEERALGREDRGDR